MKTKLFLATLALAGCISSVQAIKDIRWGSSGNPLTGLTVTWNNTGTADSISWGYSSSFEQGKSLAVKRAGNASGQNFFKYVFATVTPNATINYKLYDSNTHTWGTAMTYQTAPPVNTNSFCFLGIGDSRDNMTVWGQIATQALAKNADFAIFNGDIVASGGTTSLWDSWFTSGKQFLQNTLVYHSMGNHDATSVPFYKNTFDLPQVSGSNLYYSFTYGNALFICLNSESASDAAQYNWLKSTLQTYQNDTSITWRIVFNHRPFYTIGNHAGEMNAYYTTWWKAFDDYGVDIVCNGHDHMYERTKPINRNVSTTAAVTTYGSGTGQGRCEIVCGGAGAPLYTGTTSWFIQKYSSSYNFINFCVNGKSLHGTAYSNTNAVIDTFTINKVTVGIETMNQRFNQIEVYPNPTQNVFTLKCVSPQTGEGVVRILDLNGKELRKEKVTKSQELFENKYDLGGYAPGAYFVELTVAGQTDHVMLMVN